MKTLASVLAQYFLNEHSATKPVSLAQKILEERLLFLGYFTQAGAAIAFGDQSTATQMMQELNG